MSPLQLVAVTLVGNAVAMAAIAFVAKGVVTLSGAVATADLRTRATQVASKIRGVKAVKNNLKVKGK